MSKEKTLLNFFNKVPKRQLSSLENSLNGNVCKKSKFDTDENESMNDKLSQKNITNSNEISSSSNDPEDPRNSKENDSKVDSEIIPKVLSNNEKQSNIKGDDNLKENGNSSFTCDKEMKNETIQKIKPEYCTNESQINSKDEIPKRVKEDVSNIDEQIFVKIRRMAEKYPALQPNIGESWFRPLAGEFQKPYFQQVLTLF